MLKEKRMILFDGLNVLKFSVITTWKLRKSYLLLRILICFMEVGETFWGIILLRTLVHDISSEKNYERIILDAVILSLGILLFKSLKIIFLWMASTGYIKLCDNFAIRSLEKKMRLRYDLLENPDVLDNISNLWWTDGIVSNSIEQLCAFLSGVFIFVGSVSILSSLNIFVILLFLCITVVNSYATRKGIRTINNIDIEKSPHSRRQNYYLMRTLNAEDGKEIRIFNLRNYFLKKIKHINIIMMKYEDKKEKVNLKLGALIALTNGIQTMFLYLYAAFLYMNDAIVIADFFMYTATIGKLSSSFEAMITAFQKIAAQKEQMDRLESYIQLPEEDFSNDVEEMLKPCTLEFKDVSFRYPGTEKYVLNHVNIVISNQERISVIGKNGAGKSTLIKLICRLYSPTNGEILLNGRNIKSYSYNEYVKVIGTVFQDFRLIPFTIQDNMQFDKKLGEDILFQCFDRADVGERITKLEHGMNTYIGKGTGYHGVDMSGGEKQKIAIARMYAKDANILILDEATAAVDPISEDKIFKNLHHCVDNSMVIFISHRMSNAKLSDKIVYIDHNCVEEFGSHEELMEQDKGYAKLFRMQEKYYTEMQ